MKRRKLLVCLLSLLIFTVVVFSGEEHHGTKNYWKEYKKTVDGKEVSVKYFQHKTVKKIDFENKTLNAKVERKWRKFNVIDLPDGFLNWSFNKRIATIEGIKKMEMPGLAGPHNAIVASHGMRRKDSLYSINNAVKGVGFIPKKEKIKGIIEHLRKTLDSPMEEKLDYLISMYKGGKDLYDVDKQVSLELYTVPQFETHSFLNCMEDPGVSLVFLDIPSYEVRAITYFLDPNNPNLTDYENDIVQYINLIHSYFHGKFPKDYTAVVYFVVEVFNNTPGKKDGLGQKVKPIIP